MSAHEFDELTKSLANGTSRRGIFKMLGKVLVAGTAVGALTAIGSGGAAAAACPPGHGLHLCGSGGACCTSSQSCCGSGRGSICCTTGSQFCCSTRRGNVCCNAGQNCTPAGCTGGGH